jgi:hypothetical protein
MREDIVKKSETVKSSRVGNGDGGVDEEADGDNGGDEDGKEDGGSGGCGDAAERVEIEGQEGLGGRDDSRRNGFSPSVRETFFFSAVVDRFFGAIVSVVTRDSMTTARHLFNLGKVL